MTIRVILADDHRMLREALRGQITADPDIEIVGEAGTGAETLSAIERTSPDVVVLDISLPDISGIEVARQATRLYPASRIVALSGYADGHNIEEMLGAGAHGYVVKSAGADELIAAIRVVAGGRKFLSPEAAEVVIRRIPACGGPASGIPPEPTQQEMVCTKLTRAELRVAQLVKQGLSTKQIARGLSVSPETVNVHRKRIRRKLGIDDRSSNLFSVLMTI